MSDRLINETLLYYDNNIYYFICNTVLHFIWVPNELQIVFGLVQAFDKLTNKTSYVTTVLFQCLVCSVCKQATYKSFL